MDASAVRIPVGLQLKSRDMVLEALERRRCLSAAVTFDVSGLTDTISLVTRLPNGQILAAGYGQVDTPDGLEEAGILVRLNADLTLDPTFGNGGKLVTAAMSPAIDFEVLDDGSVLVLSQHHNGHPRSLDFSVARITPDGQLDSTFGEGGVASVDFNPNPGGSWEHYNDRPLDFAVDAQGRIVIVGNTDTPTWRADRGEGEGLYRSWADRIKMFSMTRLTADGQLDTSFGQEGRVMIDPAEDSVWPSLSQVSIAADGSILALGAYSARDAAFSWGGTGHTLLARFNDAGQLDQSFGVNGLKIIFQTSPISADEQPAIWRRVELGAQNEAADDSVLVYGYAMFPNSPRETVVASTMLSDGRAILLVVDNVTSNAQLRRYNTDGSLDASFNPTVPADLGTNTVEVSPGNFVRLGRSINLSADDLGIHLTTTRVGSEGWAQVQLGTDDPIGPTNLDYVTIDHAGNVVSQGSVALALPGKQFSADNVLFDVDGSILLAGAFTDTPWGPYDPATGSNPQDGTFDVYFTRIAPPATEAVTPEVPVNPEVTAPVAPVASASEPAEQLTPELETSVGSELVVEGQDVLNLESADVLKD